MGALGSVGKETVAVIQCRRGSTGFSEWLVEILLLFYQESSGRKFVGEI